MTTIELIDAREILDSRGNPTIEVDGRSSTDGAVGRAGVPSGASTGAHEAVELRDGDKGRYGGKGVLKAVANVLETIAPGPARRRRRRPGRASTTRLIALDGTPNKAQAGRQRDPGRVARLRACGGRHAYGLPLYRYLGGRRRANLLPVPQFNILNGGKHAAELDGLPGVHGRAASASPTFAEALRAGRRGLPRPARRSCTTGASRPARATRAASPRRCPPTRRPSRSSCEAIEQAGYKPGEQVAIALDPATSSSPASTGTGTADGQLTYRLAKEGRTLD